MAVNRLVSIQDLFCRERFSNYLLSIRVLSIHLLYHNFVTVLILNTGMLFEVFTCEVMVVERSQRDGIRAIELNEAGV